MAADDLSAVDRQGILRRVLESQIFSKAPKRREFLRYVCEHALEGGAEPVHEREIGVRVYQRAADYDPSEDNIVRVEARSLRKQLDQYFRTEGAAEPVVLRIPKGSYVPVFEERRTPAEIAVGARRPRAALALSPTSLVLAVALLVCGTFLLSRVVGGASSDSGAAASIPPHPLWSSLFEESRETYLVVADSNFASLQTYLGRTLRLEDYLQPGFGLTAGAEGDTDEVSNVVKRFCSTPATSFADVALAVKIMQLPWAMRARTSVRFARDINVRDFKNKNAILLGSVCSNPWAELWMSRLNFHVEHDHSNNEAWIRNDSPLPGEQDRYLGATEASYAHVAFLPNLDGNGSVLLLAGIGMEGTEAAGDLVTSDLAFRRVANEFNLMSGKKLQSFEAILELSSLQGAPAHAPQVVTYRLLGSPPGDDMQADAESGWPHPTP
jgi:hypothetical protein